MGFAKKQAQKNYSISFFSFNNFFTFFCMAFAFFSHLIVDITHIYLYFNVLEL